MRITIVRPTGNEDGTPRRDTFEIDAPDTISISGALQLIAQNFDSSLGYYLSCRRGVCACCVMRVNGKIETACMVPARDDMVIEPIRMNLVVRDTVVDLSAAHDAQIELDYIENV